MPTRNYETLDAIVVVACLVMVSGLGAAFIFMPEIPSERLPILSSLLTAVFGIPLTYGAFRWGNNVGAKEVGERVARSSEMSAAALAQVAGAGPPPPAEPLGGPAANERDPDEDLFR